MPQPLQISLSPWRQVLCRTLPGLIVALFSTLPSSHLAAAEASSPGTTAAASKMATATANPAAKPLHLEACDARLRDGRPALALRFNQSLLGSQTLEPLFTVRDLGALPRRGLPDADTGNTAEATDTADPAKAASTSDAAPRTLPPAWVLDRQGMLLWYTDARPARRYEVQIAGGLQGADGARLGETISCNIDSPAMPASLAFASTGVVLPAGKNGGLPIVTVNVPEVDVEFLRIRPESMAEFFDKVLGYRLSSASSDDRWRWRSNRNMQGEVSNWDLDSLAGLTRSVFRARFQTSNNTDQRVNTFLPVEQIPQLQEPGVYLAVMSEPGRFRYEQQVTYFYVSDIGLHVHQHPSQIAVFLTSLRDARALPDITVQLRDARGEPLTSARSDELGRVFFEGQWPQARLVVAQRGDEQSVLALSQPALDLSEFPVTGLPDTTVRWFIWSGRQLYRPGEELTVSVLQRDADGREAPPMAAHARWKQADGRIVREAVWEPAPEPAGYLQASFTLPADAQTGNWQLELRRDPGSTRPDAIWSFRVEDFLPERMQLRLTPVSTRLTPADAWEITAEGSWRFGAPAAGNRLQYSLQRRPAGEWLPELWPGFRFGDLTEDQEQPWLEMPEIELDAQGHGILAAPASTLAAPGPSLWVATTRLLDAGGRPVVRLARAQWWPAPALLGLRPEFANDTTSEGGSARFDIIRINAQGELQPTAGNQEQLIRSHREYHWRYADQSGWNGAYVDIDEPLETLELEMDQGRNQMSLPVAWGRYRLELQDPITGETLRYRFYAGWDAAQAETLGGRPDRVGLQVHSLPINDGTTELQATITPPHDGSAVITLETDRVLWSTRLDVSTEGTTVNIPWPQDLARHDAYLGVVVFRPAGDGLGRASTPSRAAGLAYLPLNRTDRELQMQIEHPQQVQPRTTLPITLQLKPAAIEQSQGHSQRLSQEQSEPSNQEKSTENTYWATISLVDTGILDLDPRTAPSPTEYFFGQQRYDAAWRDLYGRMIERLPGAAARLAWGGDAAPGLNPDLAIPVRIIDLFQGPLQLDATGKAVVEVDLPDFNGELELRVTAFTQDSYGSAQSQVVLAAPWIAEAAAPRYLRTGDRSQVQIDWHHREGGNDELHWQLRSTGAINATPKSGSVRVPVGSSKRTPIEVQAGTEAGSAWLELQAAPSNSTTSKEPQIQQSFGLPVLPALAREQQWQWLRVPAGATVTLEPRPHTWQATGYDLQLLAMDEPEVGWQSWASELLTYPYHCAEQTVSRAYPWLWLSLEQVAQLPSLSDPTSPELSDRTPLADERRLALEQAVMRLASLQTAGGGFAMWPGGSADPWISAWTLGFLQTLAKDGYAIPGDMLQQGRQALLAQLRAAPAALQELPQDSQAGSSGAAATDSDQIWANEAHARYAAAALAGAVLATEGQAPLATLRQLWEQHAGRTRSPLPLMHLAVALQAMGDTKRASAAAEAALATPYAVGWRSAGTSDFGSKLRDLAWSYALVLQHQLLADSRETWLAAIVDEMGQRASNAYSTQEWQALLQAGLAQEQLSAAASNHPNGTTKNSKESSKEGWKLQVSGQQQVLTPQNPMLHPSPATGNTTAPHAKATAKAHKEWQIKNVGQQAAWLQIHHSGYPEQSDSGSTPAAQAVGLTLQRRWFLPDGTPWEGGVLHSGDALVVRLDVRSEQALSQVLVVDPLPAGLALDNLNLLPPDSLPEADYDGATWQASLNDARVQLREYRDDRYVAALDVEGEISLLYRVQVLNPGQYQVPVATVQAMYVPELRSTTEPVPALEVQPAQGR